MSTLLSEDADGAEGAPAAPGIKTIASPTPVASRDAQTAP